MYVGRGCAAVAMWPYNPIFGQGTYAWDGQRRLYQHWDDEPELYDAPFLLAGVVASQLPSSPYHPAPRSSRLGVSYLNGVLGGTRTPTPEGTSS